MSKQVKIRLILVFIIFALITTMVITETFALFETNATSTDELTIGAWKIYVNQNDVNLNETITLNDFTYTARTHTENGYFAPGSSGTFDIIIDASESDVSVAYDLDIDNSELTDHPNITFGIKNMTTNQEILSNTYNGTLLLNDANRTVTIRITLTWNDQLTYDPNDSELIGESLSFPIELHFIQYTGTS